ncbi:MAG: hypothetical protein NC251_06670 [Lachnoclostridium sp.]|nr:hypothetical protein [Lachnospira sp.]MCM1248098.1 hypothetical protein [Lachnoclostridium sp.]
MVNFFLKILSMSLTASYCIILICLARLFLRKCPKIFSYLLWGIVAIRLICPVGIESSFSFISRPVKNLSDFLAAGSAEEMSNLPDNDNALSLDVPVVFGHLLKEENASESEDYPTLSSETVSPNNRNHINTLPTDAEGSSPKDGFTRMQQSAADGTVSAITAGMASVKNIFLSKSIVFILAYIWFAGALALLTYNIFSYRKILTKLKKSAMHDSFYKGVSVYTAEGLETPFVLGIRKASIYLPQALAEKERECCLAHEYAHIRRRDYLIKQCAFLFVCVHWFNPLMWLAFHLMTKDMEMSCDEMVLKNVSLQERKIYSKILLQSACRKSHLTGAVPSFGRDYVSSRIRNILKLRKRSSAVMLLGIVFIIICAIGLLTDPVNINVSLSKFISHAASNNSNLEMTKVVADLYAEELQYESELKQAKEAAVTAEILKNKNLYARAVLTDDADSEQNAENSENSQTKTGEKIEVLKLPDEFSKEITGTITTGDKVQILSIGASVLQDAVAYGDFPDISSASASLKEGIDYVMILFEDAEGVQKRGYVKKDNLSLSLSDNTMDSYVYWTAKVWCGYFCTKNFTLMGQLASLDSREYSQYIHHSEAFVYTDNPRSFPWKGYYIAVEPDAVLSNKNEVKVKLYYLEESAKPEMTVWRQDIMIQTDKLREISNIDDLLLGGMVDFLPERRCGDKISTYEEFKEIYVPAEGVYCFADFDYENKIFQIHASARGDRTFREPECALRYYLHLGEEVLVEESAEEEAGKADKSDKKKYDAYTRVKCTFTDDRVLIFPMYQKNGLWYIDGAAL